MLDSETASAIKQLQDQQALTVQALKAFLENRLDGPGSAVGYLKAIDPKIEVAPVPFVVG